jgi:hypothetical protein
MDPVPEDYKARFLEQVFFGYDQSGVFPARGPSIFALQTIKLNPMPQPLKDDAFLHGMVQAYRDRAGNSCTAEVAIHYVRTTGIELEDEYNPLLDKVIPFDRIYVPSLPLLCTNWGGQLSQHFDSIVSSGQYQQLNEDLVVLIVNLSIKTFLTPYRSASIHVIYRMRREILMLYGQDMANKYADDASPGITYYELFHCHSEFMQRLRLEDLLQ